MREILNLHLVNDRYSADKIRSSQNQVCAVGSEFIRVVYDKRKSLFFPLNIQIVQVPTHVDKKFLYFNILNHGDNKTITVEGGGVNATIIQSDIAATNGFVHIIDHVLGIPYTSVLEKLQSDPMLK